MRKVKLIRQNTSEQGTEGIVLVTDSGREWYVIELPWKDNARNISCIPEGTYKVKWTRSPRLRRYTYQIMEVHKRGGIRIHPGNVAGSKPQFLTHSRGCPLMGKRRGTLYGQKAVLVSRVAMNEFIAHMKKETFELEISNDYRTIGQCS